MMIFKEGWEKRVSDGLPDFVPVDQNFVREA